jgi:hypothetical protein
MEGSSHEVGRAAAWRLALLAVVVLMVGGLGVGCGDSADPSGPTVVQRVTQEFGHELIEAQDSASLEPGDSALSVLRRYEEVKLGGFGYAISSIDGLKAATNYNGELKDGQDESTWAQITNGIEGDEKPSKYRLYPGDVVQWDLRYWYVTLDVRATVGAFPETFTRGVFGKRFPVRVLCAPSSPGPCATVKAKLRDAGVPIDGSKPPGGLPPAGQPQRATILVGPWSSWKDRLWPGRIDRGARYSGVFARFSPDADELRLLDWYAHRVRTVGAGTGLVAAQRPTEEDLQWVVTGVDEQGVKRAADALGSPETRDAFAAAVTDKGVEKLPLKPR